ncbi:uncharacterized protein LOC113340553 [Papaver somniferum]|uniref:uncharacterized protein LOC113340553 n=1 Tax=Papaver somniferum TaxID=3469 RepID=UPI000E7020E8|nr:uncharacterized protein LOC113340553 [Papaver somniferum]
MTPLNLHMHRIGSRKGQKLLKYYCPSDLTDNVLYSKYFTDIKSTKHQTTVSWPDLIHEHLFEEIHTNLSCLSNVKACVQYLLLLFAEHTPAGLIPKVENHEEDIPRVGRWDIYQISDYIWKTDMTQFSLEKQLGISTVVPSKDDLQSWLKAQTIENSHLKEQLQEKQAMLKAVYAIAREGISEGDLSGTAEFKVHKFSCQIIRELQLVETEQQGDGSTEQEKEKDDAETSFHEEFPCMSLAAGNTPTILQAQTAAEGHKRPLRTYSSSMKSVTTCKTPPKKRPVAKQKPTPTNNVDEEQKKDVEETPVTDEAQKKAADGGVVDGAGDDVAAKAVGDDVTAKVNEDTPATVGDGLVMTAPTQPTPGTFDDSSASTQFEDSMVITATTPQTQPDNAQTYRLVQLGANPDDMTNVEVSEMIDEIVSNINKTEHGPAVTENAEPTSTATTQENVFSLGLEKTPKPAGELLKEAANTIRERQPSFIQQRRHYLDGTQRRW